ncbi:DUF4346 domain-containing protein [Candidatus Woesearchaeota archaeon]|nr:DUF4346 domain-containing protein [Candidatus Woesearchaeota archaeon]
MSKKCPFFEIDFNEDNREVVDCDKLSFPWNQDPNGYFLIKIEDNLLKCGFVNSEHKMVLELFGKDPDKIIKEIAKRKLVNLEHMGYVASELQIAYDCMINGKDYVQR